MMNLKNLEELADTHQQELLREAETQRLLSLAMGKKSDKMGRFRRIMADLVRRMTRFLQEQGIVFPRFSEGNAGASDTLRLVK
jgi:hypothetical protein